MVEREKNDDECALDVALIFRLAIQEPFFLPIFSGALSILTSSHHATTYSHTQPGQTHIHTGYSHFYTDSMFWFNERSSSSSICCAVCHRIHLRMLILFCLFLSKKNDLLYLYIRDTLYLSSSPSFISLMHSFHVCFGNLWTIGGLLKTVKILNVSYVPNCFFFFFFFFGSVHPSIITSDGCDSAEGGCNVECQLCASPFCKTRVFLHSDDLLSAQVSTGATASQRPAFACELS